MSTLKFFIGIVLLLSTKTYELKSDPIEPLQSSNKNDNFYIAKVIPPGTYRVIIWDHLINHNDMPVGRSNDDDEHDAMQSLCEFDNLFLQSQSVPPKPIFYADQLKEDLDHLKKCFLHFYTVITDQEGKFLIQKIDRTHFDATLFEDHSYKFYLVPLNNSKPIDETSHIDELFVAQQIYMRKNWEPIDSLCSFSGDQCLISYFETSDQWNMSGTSILNQWLFEHLSWELTAKENFFLIANFHYFIERAMANERAGTKISTGDAELITIFWQCLARCGNKRQLWKRLRLADKQIVPMIGEFCKIKWRDLIHFDTLSDRTRTFLTVLNFCTQWPMMRDQAEHFANVTAIVEAFRHWIFLSASPLGWQMEQIVRSWIEFFFVRTTGANIDDTWWKWSTYELNVFREIGALFVNARELFALTLDKFKRIYGIKKMLDKICENIVDTSPSLSPHIPLQSTMKQWHLSNCKNGKFQYNMSVNNSAPPHYSAPPKCVICMAKERQFAFDSCGHLCACERCANIVENSAEPMCPICRGPIIKKLKIYHP